MLNLLRLEPGVESRAEVFRLFLGFFIQKNLIIRETKGAESRRKFFGSTALQKYLKITFSPLSARLHIPAFEGTLSAFESYGSVGWKGWLGFPERQWELYHTVRADPYVRHDLVKEGTLVVFVSIQLVLFGTLNGDGSLLLIL